MKASQCLVWLLVLSGLYLILNGRLKTAAAQAEYGRLLLTELYYNTPGPDSREEWLEIANLGAHPLDLSEIKIGDEDQMGGQEGMVRFPPGSVINPGQVLVIAQTAAGFRQLFGFDPDFEIVDTASTVPDMRVYRLWGVGTVSFNNDGDDLLLVGPQNQILDTLSYGQSSRFFTPAVQDVYTGQSLARLPANCDTDTAVDWQPLTQPTPGTITTDDVCAKKGPAGPPDSLLAIGEIQGEAAVSPFINQIVTFRGVVTGFYESQNSNGVIFQTMFVQALAADDDENPQTSAGLAVFLGLRQPPAKIGDVVRVTGQVTEFFGLTEIDSGDLDITIEAGDYPLPPPIPIDPPTANQEQAAYFEAFESMLVTFNGKTQVVGATHSGCSFAVVRAEKFTGPILRETAADPNGQIVPVLNNSNIACDAFPHLKKGDIVNGLSGPLIFHFDQFKLVQQDAEALQITSGPLPTPAPPPALPPGTISLATFNLENHFDAVDDTGTEAEPKPTHAEIQRKTTKLARQIGQILGCPTIIGIQEVEKAALLQQLAAATADQCGFTYEVSHLESIDVRGIDVALLSDPRQVSIQAVSLQQTCTPLNTGINPVTPLCPPSLHPLFSRPPLQVTAVIDHIPFTIYVNHFKSKRGGETETAGRRLAQARHIAGLVDGQLAVDSDSRLIVMGDFNDYAQSEPLLTLTENGRLYNTLDNLPDDERYSFVFSGASQLIDGIFISPNLQASLITTTIYHVNADFPTAMATDLSLPYRATDHDLPLVILALPAAAKATATPTPVVKESRPPAVPPTVVPPIQNLGAHHSGRAATWLFTWLSVALIMVAVLFIYRDRRQP